MTKAEILNQKFIDNFCVINSIKKTNSIVISLSGGIDSTILFFLLKNYFSSKKKIHILIFDHQTRAESGLEIKSLINFYKINIFFSYKIFKIGSKLKGNRFQEKSRDIRISKIINYAKKFKIKDIFLGHHNDDILETLLLRKIQLSGIRGNLNIFSNSFNGLNFHRPLKVFTKNQINTFANFNKLRWFEDRTNSENIYTRNKIRNHLINKKHSEELKSYYQSLGDIDDLEKFLDLLIIENQDSISIQKFIFDKLPLVIKKHLLYKVLILIAPIDSIRSVNIDNICAIVDKSSNFNKKRSIKGGFIQVSELLINFIQIQPFKQKNL